MSLIWSDFCYNAPLKVAVNSEWKTLNMCCRTSNLKPIRRRFSPQEGIIECWNHSSSVSHVFVWIFLGTQHAYMLLWCHHMGKRAFFEQQQKKPLFWVYYFLWDSLLLDFPILATCNAVAAKELHHRANKSALLSGMAPRGWIMTKRWDWRESKVCIHVSVRQWYK